MTMEDVTSGRLTDTVQVGPLDANLPPAPGSTSRKAPSATFSESYMRSRPVFSPAWWVQYLFGKLQQRKATMKEWDAYYEGDQPLMFASERFREAFGGRFSAFSSNFMALVVDGTRERMEVSGFDFGGTRRSERAWRLWQASKLDSASHIAHTEALIKSFSYALVSPPGNVLDTVHITVEDAMQCITESDSYGRRVAGLKATTDEYTGALLLTLFMPEYVWKLRTTNAPPDGAVQLQLDPAPAPGEQWPLRNPLNAVPLVPLANRPRLHGKAQSEIDQVMSNQDAVNKYRADALVAAEYAAFRQRYAVGLEVPVDPKTGRPMEPFKAAVDRLWIIPPPDPDDPPGQPEPKFGEFSATDLQPYQRMIESEVGAISSISRLPYHYLLGQPEAVPPSGESLKSSEAGLIAKVRTQMTHFGESWEEVLRLALVADGDAAAAKVDGAATLWRDPETRNEGAHMDATVKAYQSGITDRNEARQAIGYEPTDDEPPPAAPGSEPGAAAGDTITGATPPADADAD